MKRWQLPDGFEAIGPGLARGYRRGRRALREAVDRPTDEHVHEWRKSVKTLWYHVRLLEPAAPSVFAPAIEALDHLAEALGDDHDLAVLVERLASDPHRYGGALHGVLSRVARYDTGNPLGFLEAAIAFALRDHNMGGPVREMLSSFTQTVPSGA